MAKPRDFYEIDLFPAEYLIRNQQSDPDRVAKILAQAEQRRLERNAKRLKCQSNKER